MLPSGEMASDLDQFAECLNFLGTLSLVHSAIVSRRLRQQTWSRRDVTVRIDHGFDSGLHPAGRSVLGFKSIPHIVHRCACSLKSRWFEVLADFAFDAGYFATDGLGSRSHGKCC